MSSASLVEGPNGVYAAWESTGQVYFGRVDPAVPGVPNPVPAPGAGGNRKHPVLAVNSQGAILLAWTEETGWQRGGALAWQVYDSAGRATHQKGRVPDGIPVWGLAAVAARPNGEFILLH